MDVYDEKCETKYPAKCVEDQSCTMLYQTQCDTAGYSQKCRQVPVQKCQPITKCHRIPKTTCQPIRKEKCGNKPVQVPKKQMKHMCMPYESRPEDNVASCSNGPDSGYGAPSPNSGYGAPSSNSGYGAPSSNSGYGAPNAGGASNNAYQAPNAGASNNAYQSPNAGASNNAYQASNAGAANNGYQGPNSASANNAYGASNAFVAPSNNNFNDLQTAVAAPPPPLLPSDPNEDSYGNPLGNVIGNSLQDTFAVAAPSNYNSPLVGPNAISAPNSYISPLVSNNNGQRAQEDFRTTLATIKVVDPPSELVGNGPFLPTDLKTVDIQNRGKVHPNQRVANFVPSIRLPEGFVHQNGDFELLESAHSMKKMVFPQSSEEEEESAEETVKTFVPQQILEDDHDHSEEGYGSEDNLNYDVDELSDIAALQTLFLTPETKEIEATTEKGTLLLEEDPDDPEAIPKRKRRRRKEFFQRLAKLRATGRQSF